LPTLALARSALVLYNAACVFCWCSAAARRDRELLSSDREQLAGRYLDRAMELLREVKTTGYFKLAHPVHVLKTDKDLDPLRQRDDFQKLLQEVEQKLGQMP
jgi:hypothetical protein